MSAGVLGNLETEETFSWQSRQCLNRCISCSHASNTVNVFLFWGKRHLASPFGLLHHLCWSNRAVMKGNGNYCMFVSVPQRKLTIFCNYKVVSTLYPLAYKGYHKRRRHETQFRLSCRPWGFILGYVIYLCYVGWFGCLFANFWCYANACEFVQEAVSGSCRHKISTAVKFSPLFTNWTNDKCCGIWILPAAPQFLCALYSSNLKG